MNKLFASWKTMVEKSLKTYLRLNLNAYTGSFEKAMEYAVFPGGKRIRPLLTLASAYACGLDAEKAVPGACAVEFIHSYSLIHDDLPAMDNDDFRRGKPTVHKHFGEGMAILAGDALLTLAFGIMAENPKNIKSDYNLYAIKILAEAAGAKGMIAGQAADTFFNKERAVSKKKMIDYIHAKKTGALIAASVGIGAALAGTNKHNFRVLKAFGDNIGIAFQIIDDIFDKDKNRLTYPAIYGFRLSKKKAAKFISEAITRLDIFGKRAVPLRTLAEYVLKRKN